MTGPTPKTRRKVAARDEGRCVVCGAYVVDPTALRPYGTWSLQHRVARGMGSSRADYINAPVNLITVCGDGTTGCHGRIEHNREWARDHGYAVSRWQHPALTPVQHWLHGWAFCSDTWTPIPAGAEGVRLAAEHGAKTARALGLTADEVAHVSDVLTELARLWALGEQGVA